MSRLSERLHAVAFGLPMGIWQIVFFAAPVIFMVIMTFWAVHNFQLSPDLTLDNWKAMLGADYFWDAFARSFLGAGLTAMIVSVLAFPCAFYLGLRASPNVRLLGACLIMCKTRSNNGPQKRPRIAVVAE